MSDAVDQAEIRGRILRTFPKLQLPDSFKAAPFGPDWFGKVRLLAFITPGWAIDAVTTTPVYAVATHAFGYDPPPWDGNILLHDFNVDPATFEILSPWFARDCTHVYFGAVQVRGADPATFVRTGDQETDWSDDRRVYQVWGHTDNWTNGSTLLVCARESKDPAAPWEEVCSTDYRCNRYRPGVEITGDGPVELPDN